MSNIVYNTTYDALIDLIADYYGGYSSSGMQQIIDEGLTDQSIINGINEIPNYHAIQNYDGTVRMTINTTGSRAVSSTGNVASSINSNAATGAKTITANAPAQTGYSQNGTLTIEKNINATTTKQFFTKSVVPAVAATAVGISLGKTIDSALYNANPDFWDSVGLSSLDPTTWAGITSDMDGSFGEKILGTAFNMLFGIDPNTNKTQMYIDETAYAYLALYMQQQNFFNSYEWDGLYPTNLGLSQPITRQAPSYTNLDNDFVQYIGALRNNGSLAGIRFDTGVTPPSDLLVTYAYTSSGDINAIFTSKTPFRAAVCYSLHGQYSGGSSFSYASNYTYNGNIVYYYGATVPANSIIYGNYSTDNLDAKSVAWVSQYGNFTKSEIDGIGDQDGAVQPQLSNDMTISGALNALKEQYPDLWDKKETMDVAQPDGTIKTYTYIPVPYPTTRGQDDTQPTGNGNYQNQNNTDYDPATATEYDTNGFVKLIDPVIPDYPWDDDGGDGDTPTPVTPTGSASALWKIYNPSQAQLDAFGAWLWSSDFVDQLLKLFNDPMQAIIGLHKVFVTPPTSGSGAIKVGYLTSTASANYVSGQYTDLDCGSVSLDEYFGNVFDYDPHTKIRLYLPFIGIVPLENSDVMRGKINVVYHVDVLTGTCLAEIRITRDLAGGTLYTFSGNCAVQYPVSSGSYVGIVTGLLGMAGGIAGTIASGGALAPMLMGVGASVGAMHADVEHSGKISSNAGAMGIKKPYLIIERPQTQMPTNGVNIEGLPQNKTVTLGSLSGRVKVKKCHYDGISCTSNELDKIKALLESGVYIN